MEIKAGYSYHIKDTFFDLIEDKYLMSNKDVGYRPHFLAIEDQKIVGMYWMIPVSSQVMKYENILENKIKKHGSCCNIVIGKFADKRCAFLIQNAFPIIKKYFHHVHTVDDLPIKVHRELERNLIVNLRKSLAMNKKGYSLIFTDIEYIKKIMIKELKKDEEEKRFTSE